MDFSYFNKNNLLLIKENLKSLKRSAAILYKSFWSKIISIISMIIIGAFCTAIISIFIGAYTLNIIFIAILSVINVYMISSIQTISMLEEISANYHLIESDILVNEVSGNNVSKVREKYRNLMTLNEFYNQKIKKPTVIILMFLNILFIPLYFGIYNICNNTAEILNSPSKIINNINLTEIQKNNFDKNLIMKIEEEFKNNDIDPQTFKFNVSHVDQKITITASRIKYQSYLEEALSFVTSQQFERVTKDIQ